MAIKLYCSQCNKGKHILIDGVCPDCIAEERDKAIEIIKTIYRERLNFGRYFTVGGLIESRCPKQWLENK